MNLLFSNLCKVFVIIIIFSINITGQIKEVDSVYKVVFKPFSPPVKAVVDDMLYTQAQVFMAPDIYGKSHNLLNYRGKPILLWFWKPDCQVSLKGLDALGKLKNTFGNKIDIFAFANESKKELLEHFKGESINYYVMFNSNIFAEMMYAGSLGFPRLFLINPDGYIVKILPQEYLELSTNLKEVFYNLVNDLQQK